jgi:hypothetical protein
MRFEDPSLLDRFRDRQHDPDNLPSEHDVLQRGWRASLGWQHLDCRHQTLIAGGRTLASVDQSRPRLHHGGQVGNFLWGFGGAVLFHIAKDDSLAGSGTEPLRDSPSLFFVLQT